jgi:hypothetical protein
MIRNLPLLFLFVASALSAQTRLEYYLPSGVAYAADIPTPQQVLGFVPGDRHLHHHEILAYARHLATVSDRITIETTGRTHGGRELVLLTITAPANHADIEGIRTRHLKMEAPTETTPVILWMGYSVHGNEPSGANAVPLFLYHLAAAQGPEIEALLSKSVMILEPVINPDGLDRFAHWTNTLKGRNPSPDPNEREHNETWPGGRTNYYTFDLNRDWMPVQHPESRQRLSHYHRWKPNVVTDYHEMGTNATFFFQPGIPSRNFPLSPQKGFDLTAAIARYHAKELDPVGSLYYTRESFDDFYIGKGSTYPDINGAVGILFEQASSRGTVQGSVHGPVTFPFTIRNQFLASISTWKAAVDLRVDLLTHQREFLNGATREAAAHAVKGYVFGDKHDAARVWHLLDLLSFHDVKVHRLQRAVSVDGKSFEPGSSYIVPLDQPQHRLIRGFFETQTTFTDSLFYDISSWTLPLAFNLDYAGLTARTFAPALLGDAVRDAAFPSTAVSGGFSEYAYLIEWDGYYAPRALNRLQKAGLRVKVAQDEFRIRLGDGSTRAFTYGTLLVALGIQDNPGGVHALMETIAKEDGVSVFAVNSGLSDAGIDLGSPSFASLDRRNVMLLTGTGVAANDAGELWHQFDVRWDMGIHKVDADVFNRISLLGYTTIIMPGGMYTGISEASVEKLRRWVQEGGTLIVYRNAVNWAIQRKLLNVTLKETDAKPGSAMRRYVDASAESGAQGINGAIARTQIDPTHPLFYGYRQTTLPVFRNVTTFVNIPENPHAAPMRYAENPLWSGYMSAPRQKQLAQTAGMVVGAIGTGRVIGATDNPVFRAFWFGTDKLLANAVFFGPAISASTTAR